MGAYTNPGVISEIYQDSYWNLDLSGQTSRTVDITFSNGWKAAQGGPATPPLADGLYPTSMSNSTRMISRCYDSAGRIVNWLVLGTNPSCSLRIDITHNGVQYLFVMAPIFAGTGYATVNCTKVSAGACVDATIIPTPSALGPNPNVANLYSNTGKHGSFILLGSALNSYVIHVTNP